MSTITVRLDGTDAVIKRLDGPVLLQPAVRNLLHDAIEVGHDAAVNGIKSDTGALVRGFQVQVRPLSAELTNLAAHAAAVDEGRRAGARQPPPGALSGWLGRHGIDPRMEFVIARAIARRGIKGRFFMQAAKQAVIRALPRLIATAEAAIGRKWGG